MQSDVIVIGAGTVGAAIAYGLARRKLRVLVLDGDDSDFRAARANFGLVWLQGKGVNLPAYQMWTRASTELWPELNRELAELAGADLEYERNGGLTFCLGESEFENRRLHLQRLHNQLGDAEADWEMLDRAALTKLLPAVRLGKDVSGASFGRRDGHANPLKLLAALLAGIQRLGGTLRSRAQVRSIMPGSEGFTVVFGDERAVRAARGDRCRPRLRGACAASWARDSAPAATRPDPRHRTFRPVAAAAFQWFAADPRRHRDGRRHAGRSRLRHVDHQRGGPDVE